LNQGITRKSKHGDSLGMPIKKFYFEGKNTKVIDVGLRPSVISYATSKYNLKAVAHNIIGQTPDQNRVEVIVQGNKNSIDLFYDHVSKNDIRKIRDGPRPEVSKLQGYSGKPDWNYCLNTVSVEQMEKGIDVLSGIGNDTKEMRTDIKETKDAFVKLNDNINAIGGSFVDMIQKYGIIGQKMDNMLEFQKGTNDYLKDIKDILARQGKNQKD
jgi:hypothetical protein